MTITPPRGDTAHWRERPGHPSPTRYPPLPTPDVGPGRRARLPWRREVLVVAIFYAAYTLVRDLRGDRPVSAALALANARTIVGFERAIGLFHEAQLQRWALHSHVFVKALDVWYATTHFVVTAGVLIALFFAFPGSYRRWRNTLAVSTGVALVGFALFPLMPPRLLPVSYGFTDTLRTVGGLWNIDSGPMLHVSDQYAAMPSLHFAWALWCGLAIASVAQRRWVKAVALAYPLVTLVCIIVTANHYFTDTAAGAAIVVVGWCVAARLDPKRAASADQGREAL